MVDQQNTPRTLKPKLLTALGLAAALLFALPTPPARAVDFATRMLEATYKLYNKDSTATGFFVRDGGRGRPADEAILVTAGHVLERMSGDTGVAVLRQPNAETGTNRLDFVFPIRAKNRSLWITHPDQDVAVMRLKLPAAAAAKALPLESLATEEALEAARLHIISTIYILGFPTRFESNDDGCPVARHGSVASFPLLPVKEHKTFLADFMTFAGDSGGPVFMSDPRQPDAENAMPLVLGLVLSQFRHDETVKSLYEERTVHYPLGLATVLQAQFIREAITKLPKRS